MKFVTGISDSFAPPSLPPPPPPGHAPATVLANGLLAIRNMPRMATTGPTQSAARTPTALMIFPEGGEGGEKKGVHKSWGALLLFCRLWPL